MALPREPADFNGVLLAVGDRVISTPGTHETQQTGVVVRLVRRNVIEVKYDSDGAGLDQTVTPLLNQIGA